MERSSVRAEGLRSGRQAVASDATTVENSRELASIAVAMMQESKAIPASTKVPTSSFARSTANGVARKAECFGLSTV